MNGTPDRCDPRHRRLKLRLIERMAEAETRLLTLQPQDGAWQPFAPGVELLPLHRDGPVLSYLLRMAPGAALPPHRHRLDEECVVLEGRLKIGRRLELGPRGYHLAPRGALHATLSTETGAMIYLRGAVPRADDALG